MFWGPFWVIFGAKCVRESEEMRCGSETCFGFRCRQFQKRNVRGHRSRFPDWAMRFGGGFGDIFWVPFWVVLSAKFVRESDSALQLGDSGLGMCFGIRFGEFQLQKEILPHPGSGIFFVIFGDLVCFCHSAGFGVFLFVSCSRLCSKPGSRFVRNFRMRSTLRSKIFPRDCIRSVRPLGVRFGTLFLKFRTKRDPSFER